jgi:TP901-1 family phage major tail protein
MTKYCGSDFLIQTEDPGSPGSFITVGALKDTSLSVGTDQIDLTDKSNSQYRQILGDASTTTISLTGAGLFTNDANINLLQTKAISGSVIKCRLISGKGDIFEGFFYVSSFERNGNYNGAEEFSVTLDSAASITHTP